MDTTTFFQSSQQRWGLKLIEFCDKVLLNKTVYVMLFVQDAFNFWNQSISIIECCLYMDMHNLLKVFLKCTGNKSIYILVIKGSWVTVLGQSCSIYTYVKNAPTSRYPKYLWTTFSNVNSHVDDEEKGSFSYFRVYCASLILAQNSMKKWPNIHGNLRDLTFFPSYVLWLVERR